MKKNYKYIFFLIFDFIFTFILCIICSFALSSCSSSELAPPGNCACDKCFIIIYPPPSQIVNEAYKMQISIEYEDGSLASPPREYYDVGSGYSSEIECCKKIRIRLRYYVFCGYNSYGERRLDKIYGEDPLISPQHCSQEYHPNPGILRDCSDF